MCYTFFFLFMIASSSLMHIFLNFVWVLIRQFAIILVQVNEYPPGVGLSPHIDTHSAFGGSIFSLSLAGPCVMEFRKYSEGDRLSKPASSCDGERENSDNSSNFLRAAIYLPPRSMLLLCGEARYAWHHYIPHHKVFLMSYQFFLLFI